ncbi:MAG TPA: hypothetical protein VF081_00690 [Solirubrobacterales bacterium]
MLLSWSPAAGASRYQLAVYDRTDARTVFDGTVAGAAHEVPIPDQLCNHDLVMRTRPLLGAEWGDWTEFLPLPRDFLLGERRESLPALSADEEPRLLLMFTIDTECSLLRQPNPNPDRLIDELIFGDFGNGGPAGGIGLQMDLLEHFGFRGSFFVDVLMEFEHGQRALERTIEAILERGHEVELHVHPEHLEWSADREVAEVARGGMQGEDVFRRVLELSVDLFERRVGRRPVAYRAGAYRISDAHFPVLEEFGILIDSSVQPYFNSRVADWMRTRTQPFHVGGVLEIPPTFVLLNDRPDAWETRALAPSFGLGDPISTLPAAPGGPPLVATFVSHSFQLLRCRDSREPAAIESFEGRLRSGLPADTAGRLLRRSLRATRTFGEEVDEGLVAHVAGILRRIADRPDARCATYADIAAARERLWPTEQHPPLDRIALVDRRQGIASSTGTRVFSRDLLSRLTAEEAPGSTLCADADPGWVSEVERGGVAGLRERLDSAAAELKPEQPLRLRLRTLGVMPVERRGTLPPLAELLFPLADLRAVAAEAGAEEPDGIPWDAPTFRRWFERNGFEVLGERRVPRRVEEMAALDRFAEKLRWLDPLELRTEAVELELVHPGGAETDRSNDGGLLGPEAANRLYESTQPGCEMTLSLPDGATAATPTTCLLALMRAGFEVLAREDSEYRLLRPVELADIRRFAGLAT